MGRVRGAGRMVGMAGVQGRQCGGGRPAVVKPSRQRAGRNPIQESEARKKTACAVRTQQQYRCGRAKAKKGVRVA